MSESETRKTRTLDPTKRITEQLDGLIDETDAMLIMGLLGDAFANLPLDQMPPMMRMGACLMLDACAKHVVGFLPDRPGLDHVRDVVKVAADAAEKARVFFHAAG